MNRTVERTPAQHRRDKPWLNFRILNASANRIAPTFFVHRKCLNMQAFEPFVTKSAPQILALADRRKSRSFFGFAFVAFWCGMLSIKAIDMMGPVYSSTLPSMTL